VLRAFSILCTLCVLPGGIPEARAQAPGPVQAPKPLAEASGDLDGDGRPELLRLERDGTLRVDAPDGHEIGRVTLPVKGPTLESARIDVVTAEHRPVAHARIRLRGGNVLEVVLDVVDGRVETIFANRTGPLGDGERSVVLDVGDAGVVQYQTSPTIVRCDRENRLFPERWDFASRRFRPVDIDPPTGPRLNAITARPATLPDEPLGLFHMTAASTDPQAAVERRADLLAAPHELEDRQPGTLWRAGPPGGGKGAWVTARAPQATHAVTALRIQPGPGPAPRALALIFPDRSFTIDPPAQRGPFFVLLPSPERTACVSLAIAEPPPAANSPGTALAELGIYTDADRAGGLEQLAADVAAGDAQATGAAQVLSSRGAAAARAIGQTLATAHGAGRRRLVEVLAALDVPDAAPALGRELETAPADERPIVVAGLSRLGANGGVEAARVFRDTSQSGEARADAAQVLGAVAASAGVGADAATRALLAGLGQGDATVRRSTVRAFGHAAATNPKVAAALVADARGKPLPEGVEGKNPAPDPRRLADLARALGLAGKSLRDGRAEVVGALDRILHDPAGDFAVRLSVLRALGTLGDPAALPLLTATARDPDEILRWAAIEATAQLPGDAPRALLIEAVRDADPRVRKTAVAGLGTHLEADGAHAAESLLLNDHWPMVRRAAAEALGSGCAIAGVPAALERSAAGQDEHARYADPTEEVRRAALVSLGRCDPHAPAIARVLKTRQQPVSVRELAAALVAKAGGPGAGQALAAAIDSVLGNPDADERTLGLVLACVRALQKTGDTSRPVLEALGEASSEPSSPAIRAAAQETIGKLCPDGASAAFKRGLKDSDASVRRATENARRICPK
jgi:HEAT repeat protein